MPPLSFIAFFTFLFLFCSCTFSSLLTLSYEKVLKWSIELWKLVLEIVGSYFFDLATIFLHRISIALSLAARNFYFYSFSFFSFFLFSSYFFAFSWINFYISAIFVFEVLKWWLGHWSGHSYGSFLLLSSYSLILLLISSIYYFLFSRSGS